MLRFDPSQPVRQVNLLTKENSRVLGRRLYCLQQGDKSYWLKLHVLDGNAECAQSFQQELAFYQRFGASLADFLMPFQLLSPADLAWLSDRTSSPLLLLPHAQSYWSNPAELSVQQIAAIIRECLDSLEAFHQVGWIHGDLKAEHFVDYQGQLKLLDFEQAHPLDGRPISAALSATPRYMAPELFHAQPKSQQSDLYAFGIILYEWLTQQRFAARSYQQWAVLHCQRLKVELPFAFRAFEPVLQGLVAKSLQQRFTHVGQVKQVLTGINLLKNDHN